MFLWTSTCFLKFMSMQTICAGVVWSHQMTYIICRRIAHQLSLSVCFAVYLALHLHPDILTPLFTGLCIFWYPRLQPSHWRTAGYTGNKCIVMKNTLSIIISIMEQLLLISIKWHTVKEVKIFIETHTINKICTERSSWSYHIVVNSGTTLLPNWLLPFLNEIWFSF